MRYYDKNWLHKEYQELFLDTTGTEATKQEKEFIKKYFNPYKEDGSKYIYYEAIFRLKRGWPKFAVFYLIKQSFKKEFIKHEELESLILLHKVFAEKMLNDAIKAYCKISD